jgi:hypothetical protein
MSAPRGRPYARTIVRIVTETEEKSSSSSRSFNWSSIEIHTLTGQCGHTKVHRGSGGPTKFFICADCEKGKPWVKVEGKLGRIRKNVGIQNPIAAAFIATRREHHSIKES